MQVMSKKKQKNNNTMIMESNNNYLSQEKIVEIQAEAYYRALKRIEDEKIKENEQDLTKKKYKWYVNILFVINVLFCPWIINKRFAIRDRVYDDVLVLFVSGLLNIIGFGLWLVGMLVIIFKIYETVTIGIVDNIFVVLCLAVLLILFGSIFMLAGKRFDKETDSNTIYAFSASIFALFSFVVGIIALMKTC